MPLFSKPAWHSWEKLGEQASRAVMCAAIRCQEIYSCVCFRSLKQLCGSWGWTKLLQLLSDYVLFEGTSLWRNKKIPFEISGNFDEFLEFGQLKKTHTSTRYSNSVAYEILIHYKNRSISNRSENGIMILTQRTSNTVDTAAKLSLLPTTVPPRSLCLSSTELNSSLQYTPLRPALDAHSLRLPSKNPSHRVEHLVNIRQGPFSDGQLSLSTDDPESDFIPTLKRQNSSPESNLVAYASFLAGITMDNTVSVGEQCMLHCVRWVSTSLRCGNFMRKQVQPWLKCCWIS